MKEKRPILLDGSAGTALWAMAEAEGIERASVWRYNIEQPHLVTRLHKRYIAAGSRYIQTNTFSANGPSVARESDYAIEDVVGAAVKIAREAAEGTGVGVYASFGPLAAMLEPYGKLKKDECAAIYAAMCKAAEGVDFILLETFMDLEMLRIAAGEALKTGLPVICSMTFEKRRRTMMGNSVQQIIDTLEPMGVHALGMNCSYGPVKAMEIIEEFREKTSLPLFFKPNAGMGESYTAEDFAAEIAPALEYVSYVGGCCGCDDSYISAVSRLL